jgi:hypothetical protein
MKTRDLLTSIVNLILESDDKSSDWVKVKPLRRCFYLISGLLVLFIFNYLIGATALVTTLQSSATATWLHRFSMLLISLGNIISIMLTAYFYYRYILNKGVRIYLQNILIFYFVSTLFFGYSYFYLYLIYPNSFVFNSNPPTVASTYTHGISFLREFWLFSAFQSVNGSYYRIRVNTALASIMTYIQAVFTIVIIALFIASYVNLKTDKKSH